MKTIIRKLTGTLLPLVLATAGTAANAYPVTFAFSGEVSWDYVDVPVGTVLWGAFTYDSDAPLVDIGMNRMGYVIDLFELNIGGERATHTGGSIRIYDSIYGSRISFTSGPNISLGGGDEFSNLVSGIDVRGFTLSLTGLPVENILPDDPSVFYDMTGDFFINRGGGSVYDINSMANLAMPPTHQTTSVPEPGTLWLFGLGVLLLFRRKIYPVSGLNLIPVR